MMMAIYPSKDNYDEGIILQMFSCMCSWLETDRYTQITDVSVIIKST